MTKLVIETLLFVNTMTKLVVETLLFVNTCKGQIENLPYEIEHLNIEH